MNSQQQGVPEEVEYSLVLRQVSQGQVDKREATSVERSSEKTPRCAYSKSYRGLWSSERTTIAKLYNYIKLLSEAIILNSSQMTFLNCLLCDQINFKDLQFLDDVAKAVPCLVKLEDIVDRGFPRFGSGERTAFFGSCF